MISSPGLAFSGERNARDSNVADAGCPHDWSGNWIAVFSRIHANHKPVRSVPGDYHNRRFAGPFGSFIVAANRVSQIPAWSPAVTASSPARIPQSSIRYRASDDLSVAVVIDLPRPEWHPE